MKIDITEAEILADLAWPGPPPGEWPVPAPPGDGEVVALHLPVRRSAGTWTPDVRERADA
jgi:hypothetical protein